jgi:peptidoglycan/xylan/chitin deacetylase (PgdA/CDA1 family)
MGISRIFIMVMAWLTSVNTFAVEVSFTMDDPEVTDSPIYSVYDRNDKILQAFENHKIKGTLFVCGMRIDNPQGKTLLQAWDSKGHLIANHSYSHLYYHSKKISFENYRDDFLKVEPLISSFKNFTKLYRFPFLKEGDTQEKRDNMRRALDENGYAQGYVTIDASDWYVDSRLRNRLKVNPKAELNPYKDFYLKHLWNRAVYYNDLSKKVFGREIKHTIFDSPQFTECFVFERTHEHVQAKGMEAHFSQ